MGLDITRACLRQRVFLRIRKFLELGRIVDETLFLHFAEDMANQIAILLNLRLFHIAFFLDRINFRFSQLSVFSFLKFWIFRVFGFQKFVILPIDIRFIEMEATLTAGYLLMRWFNSRSLSHVGVVESHGTLRKRRHKCRLLSLWRNFEWVVRGIFAVHCIRKIVLRAFQEWVRVLRTMTLIVILVRSSHPIRLVSLLASTNL